MANLKLPQINTVHLAGRLTQEPELRYTPSGAACLNVPLAINRSYQDNGEWKEDTSYVTIVCWKRLAEVCAEHLSKGSAVYVEGRLKSRSWETDEGAPKRALEVVANTVQFLDRKEKEGDE